MELTLTVPALLFPTISLLLLAYTNRFLALASLIRSLHDKYLQAHDPAVVGQLANLRRRIFLIRNMQALGIGSLLLSALSMYLIFSGQMMIANVTFGIALLLMIGSLTVSLMEIWISTRALELHISDLAELNDEGLLQSLWSRIQGSPHWVQEQLRRQLESEQEAGTGGKGE